MESNASFMDETGAMTEGEKAVPRIVYGLTPASDMEIDGTTIRRMDRLIDVPQPDLLRWIKVRRKMARGH